MDCTALPPNYLTSLYTWTILDPIVKHSCTIRCGLTIWFAALLCTTASRATRLKNEIEHVRRSVEDWRFFFGRTVVEAAM